MKKSGFTLLEVLIVIIIMGVMAVFGFVSFNTALEKGRAAEAENLLKNVYGAQQRHLLYNGTYTADIDDLDITVPAPRFFNSPVAGIGADPPAKITRSTGAYTLQISTTAVVSCTNGTQTICSQLGY